MIRKLLTTIAIGAVAASGLVSTASAGDWNRGRGYGHAPAHPGYHAPRRYYGGYNHYQAPPRDRTGSKIAKGVAIGLGAVILGSILANEARRHNQYEGY